MNAHGGPAPCRAVLQIDATQIACSMDGTHAGAHSARYVADDGTVVRLFWRDPTPPRPSC